MPPSQWEEGIERELRGFIMAMDSEINGIQQDETMSAVACGWNRNLCPSCTLESSTKRSQHSPPSVMSGRQRPSSPWLPPHGHWRLLLFYSRHISFTRQCPTRAAGTRGVERPGYRIDAKHWQRGAWLSILRETISFR